MVKDSSDAAQQPALLHRFQVSEQFINANTQLLRGANPRLADDRQAALRCTDHGAVKVVVILRLEVNRLFGNSSLGERVGVAAHLEVHPDLEQLQRWKLTDRLSAGQILQHVERSLQPKL